MNADDFVRTWRLAGAGGEECGAVANGDCLVLEGEALVEWRGKTWSGRGRVRCLIHAPANWPVDWDAIDAARERRKVAIAEMQARVEAVNADLTARGVTPPTPAPDSTRRRRFQPTKRPQAFTKLAEAGHRMFDAKAAAAHNDD